MRGQLREGSSTTAAHQMLTVCLRLPQWFFSFLICHGDLQNADSEGQRLFDTISNPRAVIRLNDDSIHDHLHRLFLTWVQWFRIIERQCPAIDTNTLVPCTSKRLPRVT